jgi:hypothetical protein
MQTVNRILSHWLEVVVQIFSQFFGKLKPPIPFEPPQKILRVNFSADVLRADDLLVLHFEFYNIALDQDPSLDAGAKLVRETAAEAYIAAVLPPQSFGELAFLENQQQVDAPPVQSRLAGPSWIVFRIPYELLATPYTLPDILALLRRCDIISADTLSYPNIPPASKGDNKEAFFQVARHFTAIEAPYRLYLSPRNPSRWAHALEPVTDSKTRRTELWHTRLGKPGAKPGEVNEKTTTQAHAIWARDLEEDFDHTTNPDQPFLTSLTPSHRKQIAKLSSDPQTKVNRPITIEQLMLSALGAWLKSYVYFGTGPTDELPDKFDVLEWRHIMTMGRDQYVRVVEKGYLFPFGHRANKITITERKPHPIPGDSDAHGAYLLQREFIVIRQPEKSYTRRHMPFEWVRVAPLVTPQISSSKVVENQIGTLEDNAIWIRLPAMGGVGPNFLFSITARDGEKRFTTFDTPLIWVSAEIEKSSDIEKIIKEYEEYEKVVRPIGGQKIAYAPSVKKNETTHDTHTLEFNGKHVSPKEQGVPFFPQMTNAQIRLAPVENITGQFTLIDVAFEQKYIESGMDPKKNPSEIYLKLIQPFKTEFSPQQTGGLVAPNFDIGGLSRFAGPVSLAAATAEETEPAYLNKTLLDGYFSPASIFKNVQLLGGIELGEIFEDRLVNHALGAQIPNLKTTRSGNTIETRYEWSTDKLRNYVIFKPDSDARFSLVASIKQQLAPNGKPGASSQEITGELVNFRVTLMSVQKQDTPSHSLVSLVFQSVKFVAVPNKKTDVAVLFKGNGLKFENELKLVNEVLKYVPLDGFSDPPSLQVTTDGVNLGYSVAIPTIGIGVFTLAHISFAAGFYLPFIGKPMGVRLAFCERPQPFTLTVMGLGGGGFFGITFGLDGVQLLEMALEFGAALAINLGVASGSVSVMGGVYFQMSGGAIVFEAYIRLNGELRVLGLISVSCMFYLSLSYISENDVLKGQATLKVKVKIAFFSKSVSMTVERTLKGSDPTFRDVFSTHQDLILDAPVDDWAEYAGAFAAYA